MFYWFVWEQSWSGRYKANEHCENFPVALLLFRAGASNTRFLLKEQPSQLLTASLLCLPRGVNRFKGHLLLISHFSPLGALSVEVTGIKMRQLPSQSEKNQKSPYTPYRAFQNPLGLNTANHLIMFGSTCNIDGSQRWPRRVKLCFMSPCSHIDQGLLHPHHLQERFSVIFVQTKCIVKTFIDPKRALKK